MIVCLGTTPALQRTMTFARVQVDAVNRAVEVREYASGKSINVARVARTLGERVIATGILGGDRAHVLRRDLDAAGITHDFIDVRSPTRMCATVIDRGGSTATELVEESAPVTTRDANRLIAHLETLLDGARVLVVSGTIAPGAGDDLYARCVKLARERNVATIVDARGDALKLALLERPTVVKPNRAELTQTFGKDSLPVGAEWVVVTDGSRPVTAYHDHERWRILTPIVDVISPIGSGDACAAGIAVAIARGESMLDACRLGVACGAANAMTALAGHLERATVEHLNAALRAAAKQ